jgi:hypothetical protein
MVLLELLFDELGKEANTERNVQPSSAEILLGPRR